MNRCSCGGYITLNGEGHCVDCCLEYGDPVFRLQDGTYCRREERWSDGFEVMVVDEGSRPPKEKR